MRQPQWDKYETALLIDTYWRVERGDLSRENGVAFLSQLLRKRAQTFGLEIDDTFRNTNGISFQLSRIVYLFTNGKEGIGDPSKLYTEMCELYLNDPKAFDEVLFAAKATSGDMTNEDLFQLWLCSKYNAATAAYFVRTLKTLNNYCNERKIIDCNLIEKGTTNEAQQIKTFVQKNKFFKLRFRKHIKDMEKSITLYCSFLEQMNQAKADVAKEYFNKSLANSKQTESKKSSDNDESVVLQSVNNESPAKRPDEELSGDGESTLVDSISSDLKNDVESNQADKFPESNEQVEQTESFYDIYHLPADVGVGVLLAQYSFSVRTGNCLRRENILTVSDLLKYNREKLLKIKNMGVTSVNELVRFLDSFVKSIEVKQQEEVELQNQVIKKRVFENKESILSKDFSFVDDTFGAEELALINKYKEAYEILEPEIIALALHKGKTLLPITGALNIYSCYFSKLCSLVNTLSDNRKCTKLSALFAIYPNAVHTQYLEQYIQGDTTVGELAIKMAFKSDDAALFNYLFAFLKWCRYDLEDIICKYVEKFAAKNKREYEVACMRAQGYTLEEIGTQNQVTRERVRQLESKGGKIFREWEKSAHILLKIALDEKKSYLTQQTLEKYFGQNTALAKYLLKKSDNADYTYDKNLGVFFMANNEIGDVERFISTLPNMFDLDQLEEYLALSEHMGFERELSLTAISKSYALTGRVYHKHRLNRREIVAYILNRYFEDGIHIYNEQEIEKFNDILLENFGETKFSDSARSLEAIFADVGILCDRGTYKPKSDYYITDELKNHIIDFIDQYEQDMLLFNTVFVTFEKELLQQGITNRYYLQGVLNELCSDRYNFNRDYIIKEENASSLKEQMIEFAKQRPSFFSKDDIYDAFIGVTEIIVNMCLSDRRIVNYFGKYIHIDNLDIHDNDKEYLRTFLKKTITDSPVHCSEILSQLKKDNPKLLKKLHIDIPFAIYSLLECLFYDEYQFKDRYVAKFGKEIKNKREQIEALVYEHDIIDVDDLLKYTKEANYTVYSILDFLNSFNDRYLLLNKKTLASIDFLQIKKEDVEQVENYVLSKVTNVTAISQIEGLQELLNRFLRDSDEWLVYSMLFKWSKKLEVVVTDPQYKFAIPEVLPVNSEEKDLNEPFKTESVSEKGRVSYEPNNCEEFTLNVIPTLAGTKPVLLTVKNAFSISELRSWKDLYKKTFAKVLENHRFAIEPYIGKSLLNGIRIEIGTEADSKVMRSPAKVGGFYIETNHSSLTIAKCVRALLNICGYQSENVKIIYILDSLQSNLKTQSKSSAAVTDEEKFQKWLHNSLHYSLTLANRYAKTVAELDEFLKEHHIGDGRIFGASVMEINHNLQELYSSYSFSMLDSEKQHSFKEPLDKYIRYISLNATISISDKEKSTIKQEKDISAKAIKKNYNSETVTQIEDLLSAHFKNGYRLNSAIEQKKILRFYEKHFNVGYDNTVPIDEIVVYVSVVNDGRAYSVKMALDEQLKAEIIAYIFQTLTQTDVLSIEQVFGEFRDALLYTNVMNENMLEQYLSKVSKDQFFVDNGFIKRDDAGTVDTYREVEHFMQENPAPMDYDKICKDLFYLTPNDIKSALNANPSIIYINKNTYCHISAVSFSESDIANIDSYIANEIHNYQFVSTKQLFETMHLRYPELFSNNEFLTTDYGFRNAVKFYLSEKYSFQSVISGKNKKLAVKDIFAYFAKSHEKFLFSDLENLAQEINSVLLLGPVYDNALRISQNEFVALSKSGFDVEKIDDEIESYCRGSYISIDEISMFLSFPQANYAWNNYLLESYVYHYSARFKLLNHRFNKWSTTGAIVKRNQYQFATYDSILADYLARSSVELQKDSCIKLLREKGFMVSIRYAKMDAVIQEAWSIRQKLNN